MTRQPVIYILTGEVSGDCHAAPVVAQLRARNFQIVGTGGPAMQAAGAQLVADSTHWGAVGVPESIRKLPDLWLKSRRLLRDIINRKPDMVVLVDFGAFNTRFANYLRHAKIGPIFYYFPPGSWRQEPRDWSRFGRLVDCVASPFERNAQFLRDSGIDAHWVGHPVIDSLTPCEDRVALRKELGYFTEGPVIGLLPGSRSMERAWLGTAFLDAADIIHQQIPQARFVWSAFPTMGAVEARLRRRVDACEWMMAAHEGRDVIRACDAVLVAMGTATLEAAAAITPMVTAYDGPFIAKWIMAKVLKQQQPFYAMPNILLQKLAVPEILPEIYKTLAPAQLAQEMITLISDLQQADPMRQNLHIVREQLGIPGVAQRTADLIVDVLQRH